MDEKKLDSHDHSHAQDAEDKSKGFYRIFQIVVLTIFLLPILAPLFNHFGLTAPAKLIYFCYSFACHQLAHRSVHFYDEQCAWCTRDMFIWGGILLATVLVPRLNIQRFRFWWIIPFTVPIALDGGIQTIATMLDIAGGDNFYSSTNLMRAITGGLFGLGVGMFLATLVRSVNISKITEKINEKLNIFKVLKLTTVSFLILLFGYVSLVWLWGITSDVEKPVNFLDHGVKTPVEDTWIRQKNGACQPDKPKVIQDGDSLKDSIFLPGDCF